MIYDVQASIQLTIGRNGIIDFIGIENKDIDIWQEIQLLVQALVTKDKKLAQVGDRPDRPAGHRKLIEDKQLDAYFDFQHNVFLKPLSLTSTNLNIDCLPAGSWALHLTFILLKPYISRDDTDFYILDNPVKKEWVFKVPYIAPSQWKGSLRSAMVQELVNDTPEPTPEAFAKRRFRMALLFGDEKVEEPGSLKGLVEYLDERGGQEAADKYRKLVREHFGGESDKPLLHHRGILHFYPTYFDQIDLEVINPHDRKTGAGDRPIYFECVPSSSSAFSLEDITTTDREILKKFLALKYNIDWIDNARIEKDENEKVIKIFTEKNNVSLELDDTRNIVCLKMDDGRTNTLVAKMENGKRNIYSDTEGIFNLLYVPLTGPEQSPESAYMQAAEDLKLLARGIKAMMELYGFGAKTSSGFGTAEVQFDGAKVKPSKEVLQQAWQQVWEE